MKKQMVVLFGLLLTCIATRAQYITGSSAMRPLVIDAIESMFDGGKPTNIVTRGDLDEHKAKYSILEGRISGVPRAWICLWSSSEAGMAAMWAPYYPDPYFIYDLDFNGNRSTIPDAPAYFLKLSVSGR